MRGPLPRSLPSPIPYNPDLSSEFGRGRGRGALPIHAPFAGTFFLGVWTTQLYLCKLCRQSDPSCTTESAQLPNASFTPIPIRRW